MERMDYKDRREQNTDPSPIIPGNRLCNFSQVYSISKMFGNAKRKAPAAAQIPGIGPASGGLKRESPGSYRERSSPDRGEGRTERGLYMKCVKCGKPAFRGTTIETAEIGDGVLVIRNIPCYRCRSCNKIFYDTEVIRRIGELMNSEETAFRKNSIVDYEEEVSEEGDWRHPSSWNMAGFLSAMNAT